MSLDAADLLRPKPWRGDLIAAGALPLALGALLVDLRMTQWAAGPRLAVLAVTCALLLTMGLLSPLEGDGPRPYQSLLLVAGLVLFTFVLARLADVLGAHSSSTGAGTVFWVSGVSALAAAAVSLRKRSAVCTLLACIMGGVSALAFAKWAFHAHSLQTFRWLLVVLAVVFALISLTQRERRRRHAVALVNASGLAVLAMGVTLVFYFVIPFASLREQGTAGWQAVLFVAGAALVAVAGADREPGPAYLGAALLFIFAIVTAFSGRITRENGHLVVHPPSLWFWPAFLLVVGVITIAVGLRPSQPVGPEPHSGGDPPPPSSLAQRRAP